MDLDFLSSLALQTESKVLLVVLDGLGDLAGPDGRTALEAAEVPNLNRLAREGITGFHDPVAPGITPGSGPAHIALFGYDPLRYSIGRGVLDTAGTAFEFAAGDLAARINYATIGKDGRIRDRRAGRIPDAEGQRVTRRLAEAIREIDGVRVLFQHVKEYRAAAVFRGAELEAGLKDSDPQKEGLAPLPVEPSAAVPSEKARRAAALANALIERAGAVLVDEPAANFVMLRGFDLYLPLPDFCRLYRWRACAVAAYPMYKGVARLAGMRVVEEGQSTVEQEVALVERELPQTDFLFLHVKKTDSAGEDGNFAAKVKVLEEFDRLLPRLVALRPDVLCVTGDHSTPCVMRGHSFHPVPLLIWGRNVRRDPVGEFNETACIAGGLGRIRASELMPLLLAHAGRLAKFGA
jgi:2,3-bisphosphoglycerate-independent phosphoglycerate mutase